MTFAEYLLRWSALHGDAEPILPIRIWLRLGYFAAQLIRGVSPNLITGTGGLLAVLLGFANNTGELSPWLIACTLLLLGLIDSLDGIVAVLTNRVSRWGSFLDTVVDRIIDIVIGVLLIQAGAPAEFVCVAVFLTLLHEYMRARAIGLGVTSVVVITVAEKPTRVAIGVMFFLALGFDVVAQTALMLGAAWTWLTLATVGCVQLYRAMHRQLV